MTANKSNFLAVPLCAAAVLAFLPGCGGDTPGGMAGVNAPSRSRQTAPQHTITALSPPGWQMLSAPVVLSQNFTQLGIYAAQLNPTSNSYVLTPNPPADQFQLGQGYWIFVTKDTPINVSGSLAPANQNFSVSVKAGWNQVGDPFNAAIPLSSITFNSTPLANAIAAQQTSSLFSYDPVANKYNGLSLASDQIQPWSGYWFFTFVDGTLVFSPPSTTTGTASTTTTANSTGTTTSTTNSTTGATNSTTNSTTSATTGTTTNSTTGTTTSTTNSTTGTTTSTTNSTTGTTTSITTNSTTGTTTSTTNSTTGSTRDVSAQQTVHVLQLARGQSGFVSVILAAASGSPSTRGFARNLRSRLAGSRQQVEEATFNGALNLWQQIIHYDDTNGATTFFLDQALTQPAGAIQFQTQFTNGPGTVPFTLQTTFTNVKVGASTYSGTVAYVVNSELANSGNVHVTQLKDGVGNTITSSNVGINSDGSASGVVNTSGGTVVNGTVTNAVTATDNLTITPQGTQNHQFDQFSGVIQGYAATVHLNPSDNGSRQATSNGAQIVTPVTEDATVKDPSGAVADTADISESGAGIVQDTSTGAIISIDNINTLNAATVTVPTR